MTKDECSDLVATLFDRCLILRGPSASERERARMVEVERRYFEDLATIDARTANEAIDKLVKLGLRTLPTPGQIVATARRIARVRSSVGAAVEALRESFASSAIEEDDADRYVRVLAAVNDDEAVRIAVEHICTGIAGPHALLPSASQVAYYAREVARSRREAVGIAELQKRAREIEELGREGTERWRKWREQWSSGAKPSNGDGAAN